MIRARITTTTTTCLMAPFYGHPDFVQDYLGEPVPEPIWILLEQETVSGSGISWAIFKSEPVPEETFTPLLISDKTGQSQPT